MSVHVHPNNDERPHVMNADGSGCACNPQIEWIIPETGLPYPDGPLVIHNAFDCRETAELAFNESLAPDKTWTPIIVS